MHKHSVEELKNVCDKPGGSFSQDAGRYGCGTIVRVNLELIALSLAKVVKTASLSFLAVDVPLVF